MNGYNKVINAIYEYVTADSPDEVKRRIENVLDFNINLRHSYVDNDKPMSVQDVNMEILRMAELKDLRVSYVPIGDKLVGFKE